MKKAKIDIIPQESIESKIFSIRGKRVMFDRDLANLYQVETKVLNQAVKRNIQRFPEDFMFQITKEEFNSLRSHFVTLKRGQHRKYLPYVFTEQGVAMLSGVLNSMRGNASDTDTNRVLFLDKKETALIARIKTPLFPA